MKGKALVELVAENGAHIETWVYAINNPKKKLLNRKKMKILDSSSTRRSSFHFKIMYQGSH